MTEPVDIVLCTKGRTTTVPAAVRSVLAIDADLTLFVVDQNGDDRLLDPLAEFDDRRLRHVRIECDGLGAARNHGIDLGTAPTVLFTDDDCEVPAAWIDDLSAALIGPVALAYGQVAALEPHREDGYTPDFRTATPQHWTPEKPLPTYDCFGIGASMAARRDALVHIGGFDPLFGAGAPFRSAEDRDVAYRLLLAGWSIGTADGTPVVHNGFRTRDEAVGHVARDFYGLGAMLAKIDALDPDRGHYSRAVRHLLIQIPNDARSASIGSLRKLHTLRLGARDYRHEAGATIRPSDDDRSAVGS